MSNTSDGEGILALIVISFVVGAFCGGVAVRYFDTEKYECESTLPRDVECVWAPPETAIEENP